MTAVALALVAGFLFAVGAGLQHRAARASLAALPADAPPAALSGWLPIMGALRRLVCNRVWLAGWGVNVAGFGIQAVALHHGAVGLVQPVLVTQLLFTIPVAAWQTGLRPAAADWAAGACVCAGIALFVAAWGTDPAEPGPDRPRVLAAVLAALVLAVLLVIAGAGRRPGLRAGMASVAAGLCFASTAVLTKVTFDDLVRAGAGHVLSEWPVYALTVSLVLGLVIGQDALAAGALPTAVAGMAITNPLASAAIGVLAFHEAVPTTAGAVVGLSFAGVLLSVGVLGLAQSPTIREGLDPGVRDAEGRASEHGATATHIPAIRGV
jgi:drug/metabolite transporter (DMT)-like permease